MSVLDEMAWVSRVSSAISARNGEEERYNAEVRIWNLDDTRRRRLGAA
jgi:hypothetical protein